MACMVSAVIWLSHIVKTPEEEDTEEQKYIDSLAKELKDYGYVVTEWENIE